MFARILAAVAVLATTFVLAGCTEMSYWLAGTPDGKHYYSPEQQAVLDDVKLVFPDASDEDLFFYAEADRPDLFGITPDGYEKTELSNYKRRLDFRRESLADERAYQDAWAARAATQTSLSAQATLNPPSQDTTVEPTALDSRRNETANGHPQY